MNWYTPVDMGRRFDGVINGLYYQLLEFGRGSTDFADMDCSSGRWVMGFPLPSFQRQMVWTLEQKIAFIDSARRGVPLGSYTLNVTTKQPECLRTDEDGKTYYFANYWLIDGQQRLSALEEFFMNEFPVDGMFWKDLDHTTQRIFLMGVHFPHFETAFTDEASLREMYDQMNFGGTVHREEERAMLGYKAAP